MVRCSCKLPFSDFRKQSDLSNITPVFVVLVFSGLVMELVPLADLITHWFHIDDKFPNTVLFVGGYVVFVLEGVVMDDASTIMLQMTKLVRWSLQGGTWR